MESYICPKCGQQKMIKQKEVDETYKLVCQACGFKRGNLPKENNRGIV